MPFTIWARVLSTSHAWISFTANCMLRPDYGVFFDISYHFMRFTFNNRIWVYKLYISSSCSNWISVWMASCVDFFAGYLRGEKVLNFRSKAVARKRIWNDCIPGEFVWCSDLNYRSIERNVTQFSWWFPLRILKRVTPRAFHVVT